MASGKPMDRLICGDVGVGKTEVALPAAFIAAMAGSQVAVVVPTTLLARQHFRSFSEAFCRAPIVHRAALAAGSGEGCSRGQEGDRRGSARHRHQDACVARRLRAPSASGARIGLKIGIKPLRRGSAPHRLAPPLRSKT